MTIAVSKPYTVVPDQVPLHGRIQLSQRIVKCVENVPSRILTGLAVVIVGYGGHLDERSMALDLLQESLLVVKQQCRRRQAIPGRIQHFWQIALKALRVDLSEDLLASGGEERPAGGCRQGDR